MSSVVISGDTSGAITLSAPAVAGTNTITLPAAAGSVMVSGNMPAFSAYQISNQTVTSSTFTKVTFDGEVFDTNNNFASSRFTPTVAGYYQINACLAPSSATTYTMIRLYKNGSYFYSGGAGNNLTNSPSNVQGLLYMNGTTDYLEIYTYLTGTTPQIQSGSDTTFFNGVMVRGA
jgi:hypothetical protein